MNEQLLPLNSFLLQAYVNWISANGLTPHIAVDATKQGVDVPEQFVNDGKIILSVSNSAVVNLDISIEYVAFSARFNGQPTNVYVPMNAIEGVFAKEKGIGLSLPEMTTTEESPEENPEVEKEDHENKKPKLSLV